MILQVFNHQSAIQRAGFLSSSASSTAGEERWNVVYALSTDERMMLYEIDPKPHEEVQREEEDEEEEEADGHALADFRDLRESLGCKYVVGIWPYSNQKSHTKPRDAEGAASKRMKKRKRATYESGNEKEDTVMTGSNDNGVRGVIMACNSNGGDRYYSVSYEHHFSCIFPSFISE